MSAGRQILRRLRTGDPVRDPRLERVLAVGRTPVEVTADHRPFDDGGTHTWRAYKKLLLTGEVEGPRPAPLSTSVAVDPVFLVEDHHRQYGRPWLLGRPMIDYVVDSGLAPSDRLLDVGCGALRFGIHAIRYLDRGRYCGVDAHLKSLEAAVAYELPLHGLEDKEPRLLWSEDFRFDHFRVAFDWVLDFSTSLHVPEEQLEPLFRRVAAVLRPGGRLLVSPRPRLPRESLQSLGLRYVRDDVQQCAILEGHGFESANHWFHFEREYDGSAARS